jgi:rhodanese-related sulfurtransferase
MKKLLIIISIMFFSLALSTVTIAGNKPGLETNNSVEVISSDTAKLLFDNTDNKDIYFIDVRSYSWYQKGRIPGAISAPYKWTTYGNVINRSGKLDMSNLPDDKKSVIVFYSQGPTSLKSYRAYKATITTRNAGYENVFLFMGGYVIWMTKGYPIERQNLSLKQ